MISRSIKTFFWELLFSDEAKWDCCVQHLLIQFTAKFILATKKYVVVLHFIINKSSKNYSYREHVVEGARICIRTASENIS